MKITGIAYLCGISFLTLMAVSSTAGAAPHENKVPAPIERHRLLVHEELSSRGFAVASGYFRLYTREDCQYSYPVMHTCYGNNPAAPYVTFAVPPWPEEHVAPSLHEAFGQTREDFSTTFRFDPREALVIFGQLPPPAAYFGMQTYLFTRSGTIYTQSAIYQYIASHYLPLLPTFFAPVPNLDPPRIQLFASLGNSINDVVVKNQSGAAFNQERFFIITPDRAMDRAVREALAALGVPARDIFTEPIPSTAILGLGEDADDFLFVMRYAMPRDGGAPGSVSDTWRNTLPLTVLRIRETGDRAPEPYGAPRLDQRTAVDESALAPGLATLVSEVCNRWGQPCATGDCSDRYEPFIDLQSPPISLVGPVCSDLATNIGMNCLGDTQDTTYQGTVNLTLDQGEVYAVAGTFGVRTGNATYVGLSVNDSLLVKGLDNVETDRLRSTVSAYAAVLDDPDKYFLYYFSRDCTALEELTGGHCLSIDTDMIPVCDTYGSPECHYLKLILREYIAKGSTRGPDSELILMPRLIRLQRL